ncbi:hypothetical protein [Pimelobacter simplex]|uniref:hypothetical protein n=1 Tax=Nocardioides simplex TaxID=2045 RepID=UPI00214FF3D7|nr:hypothetical protein [Pimelobacter simplex]UUW91425.1 hypothetical protein M0M43_08045 [Pimelobacter simplex]UUW95253.1 hypothetical protein M0M48_26550 [Pimelobacter simplex]
MSRRWNGPIGAATRRPDPTQVRAVREVRRRRLIAEVVSDLGGESTYERVATATGLPMGYLRWTYPTLEELRSERGIAS